jgi:hypothetical protein
MRLKGLNTLKQKSTSSGSSTGDLPACSIVPQATTLPRAPEYDTKIFAVETFLKRGKKRGSHENSWWPHEKLFVFELENRLSSM